MVRLTSVFRVGCAAVQEELTAFDTVKAACSALSVAASTCLATPGAAKERTAGARSLFADNVGIEGGAVTG